MHSVWMPSDMRSLSDLLIGDQGQTFRQSFVPQAAAAAKEQLPGILLSKLLAQGAQTPPGTLIGTRPYSEQVGVLCCMA